MAPPDETDAAPTARRIASGFTEAQTRAVAEIAHAESEVAVDALRRELARWHVLLAAYILVEIGIALLAALVAMPAPRAAEVASIRPRTGPLAIPASRTETHLRGGS